MSATIEWGPEIVEVPAVMGIEARKIHGAIANGEAVVVHPVHGDTWRPTPREAVAIYRAWALDQQERAERAEWKASVAFTEVKDIAGREAELRVQLAIVRTHFEDVWYWQGRDGSDDGNYPSSLTCPVVMSADTLRSMLARAENAEALVEALRAHAKSPTEETRDAIEALESA